MSQENTARELDESAADTTSGSMTDGDAQSGKGAAGNGDAGVDTAAPASVADLGLVMDIPVTLSMEIGQTRISISELLKLSKGSVVELQRMADEPMDVLVNGTLVARGEAVVVGDRFGIRLTDVISPQERLRKAT